MMLSMMISGPRQLRNDIDVYLSPLIEDLRKLWDEGVLEQKKIVWVKWDTMCLPKEKGGLGIRDIKCFNLALLEKWNLFQYGGWRNLDGERRGNNESLWWHDLKSMFRPSQEGDWFQNGIS